MSSTSICGLSRLPWIVIPGVCFILLGFLMGFFTAQYEIARAQGRKNYTLPSLANPSLDSNLKGFSQEILEMVEPSQMRETLWILSTEPRPTGSPKDNEMAEWISKDWSTHGLDQVKIYETEVWALVPNQTVASHLTLLDSEGNVNRSLSLGSEEEQPLVRGAKNGHVEGLPIYVNFGRRKDFQYLASRNITISGHFCLMRYGQVSMAGKAKNGQRNACKGIIVFSDPEQTSPLGYHPKMVYPRTQYLPNSGVRRDSVLIDNQTLTIPVLSISFIEVESIFNLLSGSISSPLEWRGGWAESAYPIGGQFRPQYENWTLRMWVNMEESNVRKRVQHVAGWIDGQLEPDRYVIIGTHRDSWTKGCIYPSSGVAQTMELARVFGKALKGGWRPRRTIILISWSGGESGGKKAIQEFMGKFRASKIKTRTVALIVPLICAGGAELALETSSSFVNLFLEGHQSLGNQTSQSQTGFSTRRHLDFGVPTFRVRLVKNIKSDWLNQPYPTYNTEFDSFPLVDTLVDPTYDIQGRCARITLWMALQLSEAPILPLALKVWPDVIVEGLKVIQRDVISQNSTVSVMPVIRQLKNAIREFKKAVSQFQDEIVNVKAQGGRSSSILWRRSINDRLIAVERMLQSMNQWDAHLIQLQVNPDHLELVWQTLVRATQELKPDRPLAWDRH